MSAGKKTSGYGAKIGEGTLENLLKVNHVPVRKGVLGWSEYPVMGELLKYGIVAYKDVPYTPRHNPNKDTGHSDFVVFSRPATGTINILASENKTQNGEGTTVDKLDYAVINVSKHLGEQMRKGMIEMTNGMETITVRKFLILSGSFFIGGKGEHMFYVPSFKELLSDYNVQLVTVEGFSQVIQNEIRKINK